MRFQRHPLLGFFGLAVLLMGVMLAILTSPLFLSAQNPAPPPNPPPSERTSWWNGINYDGLASFSYTYNTNDPIPPVNQFRVFQFNDNQPQIDVAQLVVQHPVSASGQFGFRVNFIAGQDVPQLTASYGLFRNNQTGKGQPYDLLEFYVSYIVPAGKGLHLDFGKFATPLGYEVIGGYDGYNVNFSRSFIFGYGLPFTQTGLKASYALTEKLSALALLTNACDAVTNLNGSLTFVGQFVFTNSSNTAITVNYLHGPQQPHNNYDQTSMYEVVGTWTLVSPLQLALDGLYADQDHAAPNGSDAIWKGLAGYAVYSFTKKFSLAFRGEVFADPSGIRTGIPQTLLGFTLTPQYVAPANFSHWKSELKHFDGHFVIRPEFRKDFSNVNSFRQSTSYTNHQFTAALNLLYVF
ncbi:MAG TPA: outer membrane beta-barrel protein [Candidatus Sulfotelmatobacter sp.]|nr:outer membrane beta-barrel protein [Candidatus Sulfotelmatobacter sp.]